MGRLLPLLLILAAGIAVIAANTPTAQAATLNTLNFQARLQTNPGGAIVADGNYNIEFKLYNASSSSGSSQGSCTGDSNCLWTETYTGADKIRVAHGYLTVNLGSLTSFPGTINWDQNLYITMNVGGTGSPSWNGEMSPRLALTAIPYAFRAGQLAKFGGTYTSTLSLVAPTGGDQNFQIGDHGAAGTYTLLDNVNGIQNTTSPQTANIAITSASAGSVAILIQGAASQSVDILDIKANGVSNPLFSIGNTGQATFRNSTDSTTAFQIQDAGGSSMFTVDTSGSLITTTDLAPKTAGSHAGAANVVTTIDTISAGLPPSIALGSDGFARMTYLGNNNLPTLARCTNADCTSKNINAVSASAMGITSIPVVVASDGFPRIAYFLNSSSDLVFVQCLDADCTTKNSTSVDTTGTTGIASSLVMGNDGFARMAFRNGSNFLSYIQCTNASCSTRVTTTVDNSVTVGYTSIGLGSDGFARILYADTAGGVLKFVQCTNDACSTKNTTTLDATTTGSFSSITIASTDGFPRISYYDSANTALKYLRCTNAACTTNTSTTVDAGYTGDFSGLYSSIAVASDGFARIAYSNQSNNVGYVQCTNTDCTTSNLSVADAVGTSYNYPRTLAMALGSDNFARIVDTTNVLVNVAGGLNIYTGTTRYVRMTSASGQDVLSGTQIGSAINPFGQITTSGLSVQGGAVINSSSRPGYYALSLQGDGNAIQALSSAGDEYFSIKSSGLSYRATDATGESSLNMAPQGVVISSTSTLTTNATLRVNQASGAGNALTVNNNGTGNLASFQKAGNDAFTIGNTGTILAQNTTNTGTAYRFQNVNGTNIVNVGTTSPMTNLLSNGDFETATTTWTNKGTGALTRVTTAAAIYYGQAGGQDVLTAANDGAAHTVTLTNGNTYTLSVYLRASTGTATNVNIGYTTGGGDQDCLTNRTVPSTGFTRFTCTFTASAAGTAIYVKQSTAVSETIYIDAVQLTNGSATSTPFSLGTLQLNGAVTSPVVIQPANDSTSAFQIQNSAGTSNLFVADTVNNAITSGGSLSVTGNVGIGGTLQVASAFSAFLGATVTSGTTTGDTLTAVGNNTSGTQTNGILYNRNGAGGTTTNGINVTNTAGTLTNGISLNGTMTTGINIAGTTTTDINKTGTLTVNGSTGINLQTGGTTTASLSTTGAALFKNTSDSSTAFQIQNAAGNKVVSVDTTATNNYITNYTFESNATGWANIGSGSINQETNVSNSYHLSGNLALNTTTTGDGARVNTFSASPTFATSPFWNFSFYILTGTTMSGTLQMGYDVGGGDVTCTPSTTTVTSSSGFVRVSCFITLTTGQTIQSLFIKQNDATSRVIHVDAVQLSIGSTNPLVFQPATVQLNGTLNSPLSIKPNSNGDVLNVYASNGQTVVFNVNSGTGAVGLSSTGSLNIGGTSVLTYGAGGGVLNNITGLTQTSGTVSIDNSGFTSNGSSTTIFKATSSNTGAFQIQNSSSLPLFSADTSGSQIVLGKVGPAGGLTGKLTFANSSSANTVSVVAGNTSSGYTLTLPTALGSTNDCLKDTGSGVLGFAACGGGSGVTTVGTFSGSSQTNGANITGTTITFGPADGTNPGMVTTGTQTLAGDKTLSGNTTLGGTLNQSLSTTSTLASFTSGNSGTQTNGLLYTRNTGGTTTNGINIVQSAGTLTNGLAFGGTIGTDIMRTTGTLTLSGASGVRISSGAAYLGVAGPSGTTGSLTFQNATNSNTVTIQTGSVSTGYTLTLPGSLGSTGDCIKDGGSGILSFGACLTATTVNAIGTINVSGGGKSANGAVITSNSLILQTADATAPGLVGTGTQTFAGDKTLTGATLFKNASNSTAAFQIQDSSANVLLAADTTNGAIVIGQRPDTSGTDTTWTKVSNATAGTIKTSGTSGIGSITASAVYNGSLYVGTTKSNSAEVYRYDGSSGNWTVINTTAGTFNGGTTSIDGVASMMVFNGMLYIGTSESTKAEMYRYDGGTGAAVFTKSSFATAGTITSGGTTAYDSVSSMAVVNGQLYIGASKSGNASVYLFGAYASAGSNFLLMGTAGACGSFTAMDKVTSMVGMNSTLYVAMSKGASQAALCVLDDNDLNGVFKNVNATLGSFNDFYSGSASTSVNTIPAMTVFNGRLVIAIERSLTAGVLQMVNPAAGGDDVGENFIQMNYSSAGQIDNGGTNFINSVSSLAVYNGMLFIGTSKSNAGEIYRYDNGYAASAEWTKVSQATAGTIAASGTASIDTISTLIPYNGKLYAGTNEGTSAEIYENNVVSSQSYALQFHAAAPGTAEANGLQNLGQISFLGDASGLSGANINNTGAFLFSHSLITSAGAYDVAEDYATRDTNLEPGDIVAADSEQDMVKKAKGTSDSVVGIYSEKPALRLSQEDVTINGGRAIPIALAGRVPVKVTTKGGAIQPGDLLAMSDVPGVAVKASKAGFIIGRSLGYYNEADTAKVGKVMIFINLSWYDPSMTGDAQQGGTSNQDATQSQQAGSNGQEQAASANVLTASDVTTSTLTVTGNAVFKGNVGIVGQLTANDLQLSGHITTKGDAPKLDLQAYAGSQTADALHQAKATIVGNDIGGKITINVGDLTDNLEPGDLVKVTFNKKYSGEPQVMLTARNAQAARLGAYVEQATDEYFIITVTNQATAGASYTFSYYVFQ